MNLSVPHARQLSILAVAGAAVALWQAEAYVIAMLLCLITAGIAVARPTLEERQLKLQGTPVLLMFAVMFVSAGGMLMAVEQVAAMLEPAAPAECEAEAPRQSVAGVLFGH